MQLIIFLNNNLKFGEAASELWKPIAKQIEEVYLRLAVNAC